MDHWESSNHFRDRDARSLPAPTAFVHWARRQCYPDVLGFDAVRVDLDWWNTRLEQTSIPIVLLGRGPDGEVVDHGEAELSRLDLYRTARFREPVGPSPFCWVSAEGDRTSAFAPGHLLTLLYLCTAFVMGKRGLREHQRSFPGYADGLEAGEPGVVRLPDSLARATEWLHDPGMAWSILLDTHRPGGVAYIDEGEPRWEDAGGADPGAWSSGALVTIPPDGRKRRVYSYPPKVDGLGPVVASHFLGALCCAVPVPAAGQGGSAGRRPAIAPVDPAAVNMLVRLGFSEFGAESAWTRRRFDTYQELLHRWAREAGVPVELVEIWLVAMWNSKGAVVGSAIA